MPSRRPDVGGRDHYPGGTHTMRDRIIALAVTALTLAAAPALPAAASAEPGDLDWYFVSATDRNDVASYRDWGSVDIGTDFTIPLVCDADDSGAEEPALWQEGTWYLDGATPFSFGRPGYSDVPLCGDWDGNGTDTAGVVRGNKFYLASRNVDGGGLVTSFTFGQVTDIPVVGDWDGDGKDTIALQRGSSYYFASANRPAGGSVVRSSFGRADDLPVAGDWDGNGTDTLALRRDRTFHITNQVAGTPTPRAYSLPNIGRTFDHPVSGTLMGDTATRLGLVRVQG